MALEPSWLKVSREAAPESRFILKNRFLRKTPRSSLSNHYRHKAEKPSGKIRLLATGEIREKRKACELGKDRKGHGPSFGRGPVLLCSIKVGRCQAKRPKNPGDFSSRLSR